MMVDDEDYPEPFGMLTVNLPGFTPENPNHAFVKIYSVNAGWAEKLAVECGAVPTDIVVTDNHGDEYPLYDFTNAVFTLEGVE